MFLHRVKVNHIIVMTSIRSHIRHFVKCSQFLQEIVYSIVTSPADFFRFPALFDKVMIGNTVPVSDARAEFSVYHDKNVEAIVDHCLPEIGFSISIRENSFTLKRKFKFTHRDY